MAMLPILSRFQYDAHILAVEVDTDFTMDQVATACAEHCINHHVKDQPGKRLRVRRTTEDDSAEPLPPEMTVAEAGLQMYDCLDIYFEG